MRLILELIVRGSDPVRFIRECSNHFDCAERFLCNEVVNYDFSKGWRAFAYLIYRMDHVDWRPIYNKINYDDLVVTIGCHQDTEFSVGVSYKGLGGFLLGSECMDGLGGWDYSSLSDKLWLMECAD